jgi:F-type H+-transporting ATPase subunit a
MEAISLKAEELFHVFGIGVTNSLFLTLVVMVILIAFSWFLSRRISLMPGMIQSGVELGFEKLLGVMESTLGSRYQAEQYFPLIGTIFIFIMLSNLLGIFPGVGSLFINHGGTHVPLFRSPAADLNFTIAFAIISVLLSNLLGMQAVGVLPHIKKYVNFSNPVKLFIGILELVSEFAKIISLSFRLFGNVFAGEVLLIIVFSLAPYIIPLPFLFMELFVGLIQAFLFAMLTLVSIALHTAHEEH